MKGIRYALRNFTALSVKEHLRSQIEQEGSRAELTPHEVELVRFAADRSTQLKELADRSPGKQAARPRGASSSIVRVTMWLPSLPASTSRAQVRF
jgi:hypothetical protein